MASESHNLPYENLEYASFAIAMLAREFGALIYPLHIQSAIPQSAIRNPHPKSAIRIAWRSLFDGKSLDAWRGYKTDDPGWLADRSRRAGQGQAGRGHRDERPVRRFRARARVEDWRGGQQRDLLPRHRGSDSPYNDHIYWTAPEYQLLDDIKGADNKTRLTCAGAAYALYPSPAGHLKPVGQWNQTRILAKGPHVEHWLNGVKLVEYQLGALIGKRRSRRASSKTGPTTAARSGATSRCRATTKARSPSATSASARSN